MKKIILASSIFLIFVGCVLLGMGINISNTEIELKSLIEAKQKDNKNEYDAMWKKISQVAEVTDEQKKALIDIFKNYAEARSDKSNNLAMKWIKESIPNVDVSTYKNLQNIIISSRERFVLRQKELIDLKREHDLLLRKFPSGFILQCLGRKEIDIQVITSGKTEKAFETQKDDSVSVFKR